MKISNLFDKTKIKLAQLRAVISDASQTESSYSSSSDIVALEERIMLSATPMAVVADAQAVEPTDCPENIDVQTEESQTQDVTNVVFVDSSVEDYQQFVNDIDQAGTNTTVVLIDSQSDGIDQITDFLSQHSGIESVHIVSHGTDGEVRLGNTQLNANTLDRYAGQIAAWSNSFTSSADILFYGCDLAATEDGQHVIEALSALTGADIVASDDLTGHADLGGDWDLEFAVGNIETDLIFSVDVQENWLGTLQTVTVNTETTITVTTQEDFISTDADLSSVAALNANPGSDGISLREAIIAVNNGAGGNTIFLGSGIHTLTIQGADNDAEGDLDIQENVTIIGVADRSSVIDASRLGDRVFNVLNGDADFRNLTITGGATSSGSGGGIRVNAGRTANLDNALVTLNSSAGSGGGIFSSGALTVTNSTISDNMATLIDGMGSAFGGGIAQSSGELQLDSVTVSGNSAATDGGGVFLSNTAHFLTNVTVSANEAAEEGGGVFVARSATGNLSHVTITNNTAGTAGGGISNEFSQGTINVTGSIIAGNFGPGGAENVSGTISSVGDAPSILIDEPGLLLGTLADNGGPVQTHALLAGSTGIDEGAAATEGETDARGFLVNDGTRDLGAFELGATPVNDNITSTNDPPVNDPPTDLSSGIELNTDGGNDAFLISDSGLDTSLTATTFEIQFASNAGLSELVLLSFNNAAGDEFSIQTNLNNGLELDFGAGNEIISTALDYPAVLQDGELHSLAVTWDSATGDWEIYLDGVEVDSGTGLNTGVALDTTNGQFVFGQEQDGLNTGYVPNQRFSGTIYDVRIWDDVRSATEIADNHREKLAPSNLPSGLVANWQFDGFDSNGEVVEVVAGNNLSVANATGADFISSTPVDDLHVDENSSVGTRVGFVIATGGDTANTYTLTNDAEGRFAIDSATGEITVANGLLLDHEANQTHNVTVAVSDSAGNTYSGSLEITVNNVNEAPTFEDQGSQINTLGGTVTTPEGVPVVIDADVEIFDAELSELNGGLGDFGGTTLTIERSGGANSEDEFSFAVPFTTGTFTNSGGRIELTFNSGVTNDQVNQALRSLQYSNSSGTPPASVDLEWTFDDNNTESQGDGGALQAIGTSTVNITPVNDPINLGIVAPALVTTPEDTPLVLSGTNAVSVDDGITEDSVIQVSLSVANGTLNLADLNGITFVEGSDGSGSFVIEGLESVLNVALDGLTFTPDDDFNGPDSLNITTSISTGLVGHYTFDDGSASDQAAGSADDGTFSGDATTVADPERGEVLSLDGVGDQVEIPGLFGEPTSVTLAAWVNLTSADVLGAEVISLGDNIQLRLDDINDGITLSVRDGNIWEHIASGVYIAGTGWHHVAATFDDVTNTQTVYLNGVVIATGNLTNSISYNLAQDTVIGGHGNGNSDLDFNGLIDDARVYTRALNAAEVAAIAAGQNEINESVAITVDPVNDAPTFEDQGSQLNTLDGSVTILEGETVVLDSNVEIFDAELSALNGGLGDFGGTTLVIERSGGANGDDAFSPGGSLSFGATDFFLNGDQKGTFTNSGGRIELTFDAGVTNAEVNQIMQSLQYNNTNDVPPASVDLVWTFDDNNDDGSQGDDGALQAIGTRTVNITTVNDAPTITGLDNNVSYTENAVPIVIDNDVVLFDAELQASGNYDGATLQLGRASVASAEDEFSSTGLLGPLTEGGNLVYNGVTVGSVDLNSGGELLLQFNSDATDIVVNGVARAIAYANSSDAPPASVDIEWTFSDQSTTGGGSRADVANIEVIVTQVNDAPVLDNSGDTTLTSILEDSSNNTGDTVAAIITSAVGDRITDVDAGDAEGIAVFFADTTNGTWEYSIDDGATWLDLGTASPSAAILLDVDALIRFEPNPDFNGTANFSFRAWDQTTGDVGDAISLGTGGDSLSAETGTASVTVTPVNDAPEFNNLNGNPTFVEGGPAVSLDADVEIFDVELSRLDNFGGASITLSPASGDNVIGVNGLPVSSGPIIVSGFDIGTVGLNANGAQVFEFNSNATNALVNQFLQSLTYENTSTTPPASVNVEWTFSDGNAGGQGSGGALEVTGTTIVDIVDNTPPTTSDVILTPGDEDTVRVITEAELLANAVDANNDALSVTSLSISDGLGALVDNGDGTWTYTPASNDDTDVQFFYTISDGTNATSGSAFLEINPVNDAPVIDLDADDSSGTGGLDFNTEFVPGGGPVSLANGVAITDIDSTIRTLTIQIADNRDVLSEVLSFTSNPNITANFVDSLGQLRLLGGSGATNSDFEAVINSLTYENTSATLDTTTREITFVVNDGGPDGLDSLVATAFVSLTGDVTAPTEDNNTGSSVNEGGSDFIEISELSFSDDLQPSGDITFNVTSPTSNGFLAFESDPTTRIIRFTQADIDSNSLIYVHNGGETLSDSFTFTVDDGQGNSVTGQTFNITVVPQNDAPENSVPGSQTTDEDTPLVFNSANGNLISISDADASDSPVRVTLTVPGGTITLGATTGINLITGTGTNDTTVTFEATQALANSALDGLTYNPTADFSGLTGINILTDDLGNSGAGGALSDGDVVFITVNPVNDAPVTDLNGSDGTGIDYTTTFVEGDSPVAIADIDATITDVDSANFNELTINLVGMFDGTDELIFINGVEFEADDDDVRQTLVGSTMFNLDFDGSSFTITRQGGGTIPQADLQALLRSVEYQNARDTPSAGIRTFEFIATDASGEQSVSATTTVDVQAVNDAPTTTPVMLTPIAEDSVRLITQAELLANASDVEGDGLTATGLSITAGNGTLVDNGDGTWTYTPGSNDDTDVSFDYVVTDGTDNIAGAATLDITPVNDAPEFNNLNGNPTFVKGGPAVPLDADVEIFDVELSQLDNFDGASVTLSPASGDSVIGVNGLPVSNGDPIIVSGVNIATVGFSANDSWVFEFNSNATNALVNQFLQTLTYVNTSATAPASVNIEWTFSDGNAGGQGSGGAIEVTGTTTVDIVDNTPPTTSVVTLTPGEEDTVRVITEAELLANASDIDNDALSVSNLIVTAGSGNLVDNLDGTWTYTPLLNNNVDVEFFYIITDGINDVSGTAFLEVNPVNDAPVVNSVDGFVDEGQSLVLDATLLSTTDPEQNANELVYSINSLPGNGLLFINGSAAMIGDTFTQADVNSGLVQYTHSGTNTTTDSFIFSVTDGQGEAVVAQVFNLTINPVNDVPVANADTFTVAEDSVNNLQVLGNDSDDDGDALSVSLTSNPNRGGTAIVNADGSVNYQPAENFFGTETFQYQVSDGNGGESTASVTVTVTPVNDAPIVEQDFYQIVAGQPLISLAGILQNDFDIENSALTAILLSGPTNGTLSLLENGQFVYAPAPGFVGVDRFTYLAFDGSRGTASTVEIDVAGGVLIPTITPDLPVVPPTSGGDPVDPVDPVQETGSNNNQEDEVDSSGDGIFVPPQARRVNVLDLQNNSSFQADGDLDDLVVTLADQDRARSVFKFMLANYLDADVIDRRSSEELEEFRSNASFSAVFDAELLFEQLDDLERSNSIFVDLKVTVGAVTAFGTLGYILWALRGGALVALALSQLPAWQMIDPLPILDGYAGRDKSEKEDLDGFFTS